MDRKLKLFIEDIKNKETSFLGEDEIMDIVGKLVQILGWDISNNSEVYQDQKSKGANFVLKLGTVKISIYTRKMLDQYVDEMMESLVEEDNPMDCFATVTNGITWKFFMVANESLIYEDNDVKQIFTNMDLDFLEEEENTIISKLNILLSKESMENYCMKERLDSINADFKNISTIKPGKYKVDAVDHIYEKVKGELSKERIRKLLSYGDRLKALKLYDIANKENWNEKRIKSEIKAITDRIV